MSERILEHRIVLAVTVHAPRDFSNYDLLDIIRFQLNLSHLDSSEVDYSAATIVEAKLMVNPWRGS